MLRDEREGVVGGEEIRDIMIVGITVDAIVLIVFILTWVV